MPAITSGKVLVSGANGFIAVWVVRSLLEQGYSVRGTVRSADKGKHLKEVFASYGDKFEVVEVPDITVEGAFDDAVKGVDAIEHTASPFHFKAEDPAELLEPAVKGTVGILESARKHGTSVKRVIITSSVAAVLSVPSSPQVFTEADWNDQAVKEVEEKGREASNAAKYRASKTLAERAAWDFHSKHKAEVAWDVVALNPPMVFGPIIHEVSSPHAQNTSSQTMYDVFTKEGSAVGSGSWVDVRDIALAHVLGLQKEEAGGERIIISAGAFSFQDLLDAAPPSSKHLKGTPGAGKDTVHQIRFNADKSVRLLGLKYHTMAETVADTLEDWEKKGW
ncbi:D-lactaldehyde dehydrogenase [Favolaschia claudopus]|uniref:D-lactaldehyde dehydrogenase n=1 Tax=Favolaschia claudopus TaxID=2862362 RepID=A0AAW0A9E2_9AGAR